MRIDELVTKVARDTGIKRDTVRMIIDSYWESVYRCVEKLEEGDKIYLSRFGKLTVTTQKAKKIKTTFNNQLQEFDIPEMKIIRFRPASPLRFAVNKHLPIP